MILLDKQLPTTPADMVSPEEAYELINKLEYELSHSSIPGVGLASPQIGINKAVAIVRVRNSNGTYHRINLINPKLVEGHNLITYNEGCLSFPDKSVNTIRYAEITIETMDDYEMLSAIWHAERYNTRLDINNMLIKNTYRQVGFVSTNDEEVERLICVAVQHEMAHLINLTFLDFRPQDFGRNEICICGSGKKNKRCCNIEKYNKNLAKLFKPSYRNDK